MLCSHGSDVSAGFWLVFPSCRTTSGKTLGCSLPCLQASVWFPSWSSSSVPVGPKPKSVSFTDSGFALVSGMPLKYLLLSLVWRILVLMVSYSSLTLILILIWSSIQVPAVSSLGFEALNEIWTLMLCMQNAWQMYQVVFYKCMYSLLCTCLVCKHF